MAVDPLTTAPKFFSDVDNTFTMGGRRTRVFCVWWHLCSLGYFFFDDLNPFRLEELASLRVVAKTV